MTGRRIGAAFIDLIAFWALFWIVFVMVADTTSSDIEPGGVSLKLTLGDTTHYLSDGAASGYLFAWTIPAFLWFGVLPGLTGWTPGKLLTGIRVVGEDGTRAGVGPNLLRAGAWLVDGFPYIIPGLVGFVMILAGGGRRVADRMANTHVVASGDVGRAPTGGPTSPAAGWYPDPGGGAGQRWWDGSSWTDHTA